jgi:hypothetical protein
MDNDYLSIVGSAVKFEKRYTKLFDSKIAYHFFLKELDEAFSNLENRNDTLSAYTEDYINSSFAGLFWLDRRCTQITDVAGLREFTIDDVKSKIRIDPNGYHLDRDIAENTPRGRITLIDGIVLINIGTDCSDSTISLVKREFGLEQFESIIQIVKEKHWNIKEAFQSSFIGLFWMNKGHTDITDVAGLEEFTNNDIEAKHNLYPQGSHKDKRIHGNNPRGRVTLVDGLIVINVGEDCPDFAIPIIKREFGLDKFDSHVIVMKEKQWNVK